MRARVRAQAPVVQGALSKDGILRVLRRSTVRFRRAYQQSLKSNPSLAGKITVRFTIGPDGRVKKAKITTSTLNDAAVEARILAVIRRLRFPKPSGGGTVEVSYPFVFSPR